MSFERYSADAKRAVELASEEAHRLGHSRVGTEHLLLGLLALPGTVAATALGAGGASLALCREKVTEALASRATEAPARGSQLPFTERATRALDRAGRLASRRGSEEVLPEHVLLSVLDVEGTAGQVLRGLSVDLAAVRHALSPSPETAVLLPEVDQAPAVTGPLCAKCGSPLQETLGRATIASADAVVIYCTACGTPVGAAPAD